MAREIHNPERFDLYQTWRKNATNNLYVQDLDQIEYTYSNDEQMPVAVIETKSFAAPTVEDNERTCTLTSYVGMQLKLPAMFVRYSNIGHDGRYAFSVKAYPLNREAEELIPFRGQVYSEAEYVELLSTLHDSPEDTSGLSTYKRDVWPNDNPYFPDN